MGDEASPIKLVVMVGFHHRSDEKRGPGAVATVGPRARARPHVYVCAHALTPLVRGTSKGHQVEWAFPTPGCTAPDFRHLAMLCLPEGAHNVNGLGHVFFSIELALTPNEPRQVPQ